MRRILVPYKPDEFPRVGPRCPTCGCSTIWCGDATSPPFGDIYYCRVCDTRHIEVCIRDGKEMLKEPEKRPQEIDLTCLSKLDQIW